MSEAQEFTAGDPVLGAVVQAATRATGAAAGWIVAVDDGGLRVVAAAGEGSAALPGRTVASGAGAAGFVVASGQPLALSGGASDARLTEGVPALAGRTPHSVLCVPCTVADETVLGALELVDREGGSRFTFDDVELATLLASIAGTALAQGAPALAVPTPAELAGDLHRLASADPDRYAAVAGALRALLGE